MANQTQEENVTNNETQTSTSNTDPYSMQILASVSTGIAICGFIGNILGSFVLHRMQRINKGLRLLKYLALIDIVVIVFVFFATTLPQMSIGIDIMDIIHWVLDPFPFLLGMTFYMFEIYLTVLIAIQRSIALALPFQFEQYMRDSVVNKILGAITIFTIAYNIPLWLIYCPCPYWNEQLDMMLFQPGKCQIIQFGSRAYHAYMGPVTLVFRCIIPLIILIISNIILIISRRRMNQGIHRADDRGADQLTMVIISITTLSVITHVTTAVQLVLTDRVSNTAFTYLTHATALLIMLNCSTNFIFYYSFGKEFRKGLTSLCRSNGHAAGSVNSTLQSC